MAANRGGRGNRGKGRGPPGSALGMGGRRGGRRTPGHPANAVHRSALDSQYGSYGLEDQGMSVEELVALIQNLNPKQRIPDAAFHALFHFDSRATALLLKDLSKAGMGARASELFEWLRGLELGHPLQVAVRPAILFIACGTMTVLASLASALASLCNLLPAAGANTVASHDCLHYGSVSLARLPAREF